MPQSRGVEMRKIAFVALAAAFLTFAPLGITAPAEAKSLGGMINSALNEIGRISDPYGYGGYYGGYPYGGYGYGSYYGGGYPYGYGGVGVYPTNYYGDVYPSDVIYDSGYGSYYDWY